MAAPLPVELHPHDSRWTEKARAEAARLAAPVGDCVVAVHHIGSTAIPNIRAKPILDLMPVVTSHAAFEKARPIVEGLGYVWRGEFGLPGRRYCVLDDPATGRRAIQAHCYERGSSEIVRHLAFRDHLRAKPDRARAYEIEKLRCQALHPLDSHAYTECKNAWIRRVEAEALAALAAVDKRRTGSP